MLNIKKDLKGDVLTVYLEGKMNTSTAPKVAAEINEDIDKAQSLVIDMKDLKYISSAGLRIVVTFHKKMKQKGGLKLKNVNKANMEVFEFTGFTEFLNIE